LPKGALNTDAQICERTSVDEIQAIPEPKSTSNGWTEAIVRRLKCLLTLLTLAAWTICVAMLSHGSGATYALLSAFFSVLLAAVFVTLSALAPGKEETSAFGLGARFLSLGPPALAIIYAVAATAIQMSRNLCNPFRGCSWSEAFAIHAPIVVLLLVSLTLIFCAIIIAASFFAGLMETALCFRNGRTSGYAALRGLLRSRRLKCSLAMVVLIGWYASIIVLRIPLLGHLHFAVAMAFLLAVLLLELPAPVGVADRSISELGTAFLLAAAPALAALIVVHIDMFGLYGDYADLFFPWRLKLHVLPTILHPLSYLWTMVPLVATLSLEFYAIMLFAFLSIELLQEAERLLVRKVE
jgi:hypothetical protein